MSPPSFSPYCYLSTMMGIDSNCVSTILLVLVAWGADPFVQGQNLDRFTYEPNNVGQSRSTDFSPENWGTICRNSDVEQCIGYPDKWESGREWSIKKNYCKWCPEGFNCGRHHQSPVDLKRDVGLDFNVSSQFYSDLANECIVSRL